LKWISFSYDARGGAIRFYSKSVESVKTFASNVGHDARRPLGDRNSPARDPSASLGMTSRNGAPNQFYDNSAERLRVGGPS